MLVVEQRFGVASWSDPQLVAAGVVRRSRPDSDGNPVFVLHPDVLDRADVLTMAGRPAFDVQGQEFEVSVSGEGKVQVVDRLLAKQSSTQQCEKKCKYEQAHCVSLLVLVIINYRLCWLFVLAVFRLTLL